jgi:RNA polymerase sigma-70 factor (ECF subfamily)
VDQKKTARTAIVDRELLVGAAKSQLQWRGWRRAPLTGGTRRHSIGRRWCVIQLKDFLNPLKFSAMNLEPLLERACQGDALARGELIQATYDQLRVLAAASMRSERPDHTLTATALVHEVSLQLLEGAAVTANNQAQFLALAAKAMRNLLIDHARGRARQKRGGHFNKLSLNESLAATAEQGQNLVDLDEALQRFSQLDARKGQVVELRYFGGLSIEETAQVLNVSPATVKRDWDIARAWLLRELKTENERV